MLAVRRREERRHGGIVWWQQGDDDPLPLAPRRAAPTPAVGVDIVHNLFERAAL